MARILMVDDEGNIRMMVRLALKQAGHSVDLAAEGLEGLERFGDGRDYDLVLLDQRMPGMEGLDVLREMRARDPRARVIMVTAFGTIDLAVDAMRAGATDFLRKPFTAEALRGAVTAALGGSNTVLDAQGAGGVTFGSTTINGYRIEFRAGSGQHAGGEFRQAFTVRSPDGREEGNMVVLPDYVAELIKAHADVDQVPGGDRFWQAVCEEALANALWQNADFPPEQQVRVEELTTGLRRFVDAVLAA